MAEGSAAARSRDPGTWDSIRVLGRRLVLCPGAELRLVLLEVEVSEVQRVVGDLPERVALLHAQPEIIRASLDGFPQHGKTRVVLALQDEPQGCRVDRCLSFLALQTGARA